MQLFYTPDITLPSYVLSEPESKHVLRVLRLSVGDFIWLTDGRGSLHKARIVESNPKRCLVEVVESTQEYGRRDYQLTMAVAPTKSNDRFEWFLEKATEVGCDSFIPLLCAHSERRVVKRDRIMGVVTGAVKQSLKAYHPDVEELIDVRELISRPFNGTKLIAHCDQSIERKHIDQVVKRGDDVLILIGPEGDFSKEEINFALENGFHSITLGDSRLRVETAGLYAVMNLAFINQYRQPVTFE